MASLRDRLRLPFGWPGLRARLLVIVLLAVLPVAGWLTWTALAERRAAEAAAGERLAALVRLTVRGHQEVLDNAREILLLLAQGPAVRAGDAATCARRLATVVARSAVYANLGAIRPDGEIFCSAVPMTGPVNVVDRPEVREAVATGGFSRPAYARAGLIVGRPVAVVAHPVTERDGRLVGLVFAAIALDWFGWFAEAAGLPPEASLLLLDGSGRLLAGHPERPGLVAGTLESLARLGPGRPVTTVPGPDGVEWVFAAAELPAADGRVVLGIGVPRSWIVAPAGRRLLRDLTALGGAALLAVGLGWLVGSVAVVRPARAVTAAIRRLATGDLTSRAAIPGGGREIRGIAAALDGMAVALRARQAEAARNHAALRGMVEVAGELAGALDLDRLQEQIVGTLAGLLRARRVGLMRLDGEGGELLWVAAAGEEGVSGWVGRRLPVRRGLLALALGERRPVWSPDFFADPRVEIPPDFHRVWPADCAAMLVVPLLVGDDPLGVLALAYTTGRSFTEEEVWLADAFARQAALAVRNARLLQESEQALAEARQRRDEAEAVAALGRDISASLDLDSVLQRVVAAARDLTGADSARIGLREPEGRSHRLRYWVGPLAAGWHQVPIEPGQGLAGLVLDTGRPLRTDDYLADPRIGPHYRSLVEAEGLRAALVVPIVLPPGVEGLLTVVSQTPGAFTDRHQEVLVRLATTAAVAIRNARLFEAEQASRRRLEELVRRSPAVIYAMDGEGRLTDVADNVVDLLGHQPPEVLAPGFLAGQVHPEDAPRLARPAPGADEGGQSVEYRVRHRDGSYRWVRDRRRPVRDDQGRLLEVVGHLLDVTAEREARNAAERRRAEAEAAGRRQQAMAEIGRSLAGGTDAGRLLQMIAGAAARLLDANALICVLEGERELVPAAWTEGMPVAPVRVALGQGVAGRCAGERRGIIVNDYGRWPRALLEFRGRVAHMMAAPLLHGERLLGVIVVNRTPGQGDRFTAEDLDLLEQFAAPAAISLWSAQQLQAIQEERQRLRGLIDGLGPDMFVGLMTTDGTLLEANRPALEAAGLSPDDVIGKPVPETYWWSYSEEVQRQLREAIARAAAGERSRYDVAVRVGQDRFIVIDFSIEPLRDREGRVVLLVPSANVITERKRAEEALRDSTTRLEQLSRRLLAAQEAERRQIARELHDEIGQALTALKLMVEAAARLPEEGGRARLDDARTLLDELMTRVRQLSLDLRPSMLDDLGLVPALVWLLERFEARTGVRVKFSSSGLERRLPGPVETVAFRIVQEALTNVARHAAAGEATVLAVADGRTLRVVVEDQGRGFDPAAAVEAASGGLSGMRERASLLGGACRIDSAPGAGTRVIAELPLEP